MLRLRELWITRRFSAFLTDFLFNSLNFHIRDVLITWEHYLIDCVVGRLKLHQLVVRIRLFISNCKALTDSRVCLWEVVGDQPYPSLNFRLFSFAQAVDRLTWIWAISPEANSTWGNQSRYATTNVLMHLGWGKNPMAEKGGTLLGKGLISNARRILNLHPL